MPRLYFSFFLFVFPLVFIHAAEIVEVRTGIENTYKNGLWTPIHITLSGNEDRSAEIKIQCSDGDGTPIVFFGTIFGNQGTVYIKPGRANEKITLQLSSDSAETQCLVSVPAPVRPEKPVYLIIGNEDIGLQGAVAELALKEDRRPLLVKIKSAADLPDKWFGYESVDTVVLATAGAGECFESLSQTALAARIEALNEWLKLGGKLLFIAGKDAEHYLGKENGLLNLFLPGTFSEMTEMRQGTPFETFIGSKRPILMTGTNDAPFMKLPRFVDPQGIVFAKDGDCPLLVRKAQGLGILIYFGGDLSSKPLSAWKDRVKLVSAVMQWENKTDNRRTASNSISLIQLGYNDLSGQIRSALDRSDESRKTISFSLLLIILTAYWLFIGLFDWFVIRKILNRPAWTWLTFPLWIAVFSVLSYVLVLYAYPQKPLISQLQLIDTDGVSGTQRNSTWVNLYSPNDAEYSFSGNDKNPSFFSFFGLPGSGFGGMAPKTVSPKVWKSSAGQKNYSTLENVPVQIRSSKSFFGQSTGNVHPSLVSDLTDEEGIPMGTLTAPDTMPALDNALLIYGRWALPLGSIEPKQTVTLDKKTPRREMKELLVSGNAGEQFQQLSSYNPQSMDLEYIVRVLTLHSVLGGFDAAGLHHTFQHSLDMSGLLSADRVILLGSVRADDKKDNTFSQFSVSASSDAAAQIAVSNTVFFRQSLLIKLTALSPRLKIERQFFKQDALEQKITPASAGSNPFESQKESK
ncbi:hypothetical protein FACS189419_04470 [Planctomycetales bacterium]|nr:hypothetical protein FACS189419_04470 [Planctomycetales bacterium]